MGNIVGERFENYVLNQIAARQKLYGQGYKKTQNPRSSAQLQLINNKNAWLKMASSVGVTYDGTPAVFSKEKGKYVDASVSKGEQRLKNIGINDTFRFIGNKLAKQTVLFNTLSTVNPATEFGENGIGVDGSYNFRSGVSKRNSLWNSSNSYGLGGTNQGLVPAPGLISFKVDSQNRGSIRKGTVELMCYNKFQFELIELVYLRLGYTMMIEWGWDKFTTNSKDIKKVKNTIIEDIWFNKGSDNMTQLQMIRNVEKYRKIYSGNYDGFYGRVTNFNWGFNPDGTYSIKIDLYSVGDVIESIKVDTRSSALTVDQIKNTVKADEDKFGTESSPSGLGTSPIVTNAGSTALAQSMFSDIMSKNWDEKDSDFLRPATFFAETEPYSADSQTDQYNYFMTFGALIDKLKTFVIPKILNENGFAQEMIYFDQGDEEYCAIYPNQISLDPRIALIKPPITSNTDPNSPTRQKAGYIYFDPGWDRFKQFAFAETIAKGATCNYGKIRNIYINYNFISQQLEKATKTIGLENQLSLFKFLQSICNGINKALGGVNNLEVTIREDNFITIAEQNPIPGIEALPRLAARTMEVPSFELFGFNPNSNQSNFVKDFSFDTQITPELATSIVIGTTANGGNTKNYDATAFNKWNRGLYDRFNMEMIDPATEGIYLTSIALSERATELGIVGNAEISPQEGVTLYEAFSSASFDNDAGSNAADRFVFEIDIALTTYQYGQKAYDFVKEGAVDIGNTIYNWFTDEKNQKPTFGYDNVEDVVDPDLSEYADRFYAKNLPSTALGVTLPGKRTIEPNSVYGEIGDELTWSEYVQLITDARISERVKQGEGKLTKKELMEKFGDNYSFYLTRIFGGDFVAGTADSAATRTSPNVASYFQFNPNIIKEGQAAFKSYIDTLNNFIYERSAGNVPSNTIGFIPVSMNINFEGMSGIKIYNQINIQQNFLPSLYPDTFKFIIKTVNHTISDNKWDSTIDTVSTPRTFPVASFSFDNLASAADAYVRGQGGGGGGYQEYFGPAPNAQKVRDYIATTGGMIYEKISGDGGNGRRTVGYHPETNEKRGELSSGGDISLQGAEMTVAVMKAMRKNNPTIRVRINGGNDLFHHNKPKSYTSRHESGNGVDFIIENPSKTNLDATMRVLNSFLVGPKNWWYIDEYGSPTTISTGSHFHMSVGSKTERDGAKQIPIAEAQLAAGTIKKLP